MRRAAALTLRVSLEIANQTGLTTKERTAMNETSRDDKVLNNVVRIDDERIKDHLGKMMRSSVEETLNAILDAEAETLTC